MNQKQFVDISQQNKWKPAESREKQNSQKLSSEFDVTKCQVSGVRKQS